MKVGWIFMRDGAQRSIGERGGCGKVDFFGVVRGIRSSFLLLVVLVGVRYLFSFL